MAILTTLKKKTKTKTSMVIFNHIFLKNNNKWNFNHSTYNVVPPSYKLV